MAHEQSELFAQRFTRAANTAELVRQWLHKRGKAKVRARDLLRECTDYWEDHGIFRQDDGYLREFRRMWEHGEISGTHEDVKTRDGRSTYRVWTITHISGEPVKTHRSHHKQK